MSHWLLNLQLIIKLQKTQKLLLIWSYKHDAIVLTFHESIHIADENVK